MFDNAGRALAAPTPPPITVEFYRVQLERLQGGEIFVSLIATTLDEEEPQLLDQEIASGRVATIDDALALVKARVHFS
jgi:hypothetical protein